MTWMLNQFIRQNGLSYQQSLLHTILDYLIIKLHALAFHRPDHLPFPESMVVIPASENDLNVHKQNWCSIPNRSFFSDKIYNDTELSKDMASLGNSKILTPVKRCHKPVRDNDPIGQSG
jgi:hypothetical protein